VTEHFTGSGGGEGVNCLAATVGNGWYNVLPLRMWGRRNLRGTLATGHPRLIAQLEIELADGTRRTIATDTTGKVAPGPMLRNSILLGEVYDATKEVAGWSEGDFDDSTWSTAAIAQEPVGPLLQYQVHQKSSSAASDKADERWFLMVCCVGFSSCSLTVRLGPKIMAKV